MDTRAHALESGTDSAKTTESSGHDGNEQPFHREGKMTLRKMRLSTDEKGFTLIELMIVIAIIGILAAIAIPNFISYRDKAYCSSAESDANALAGALADYFAIPSHTTLGGSDIGVDAAGTADVIAGAGGGTIDWPRLSGSNSATVSGGVSSITILVRDDSERCPLVYRTSQEDAGWSITDNTFSKTME